MFCVAFTGRLKGTGPRRSEKRLVPTQRGAYVEVENVVIEGEDGDQVVTCKVYVSESFGMVGLLVPCVWNSHDNTPLNDMYALPTWLQLVCKPHEFTLPETEHSWDLIPVMVAICMRLAMASILASQQGTKTPSERLMMALLVDAFDKRYNRYNADTSMAIDDLILQIQELGHITPDSMGYCLTIGGYLLAHFFELHAYAPQDVWQSAINNAASLRDNSALVFHSNMSDVRCKIIEWMCGVEDELRLNTHTSCIIKHASHIFKHTIHTFDHYDTITILSSRPS